MGRRDISRMNTQTNLDHLITLVLSLSIPEQARLCDALLDSLESFEPDLDDATREGERTLAVIEQALSELPTNTKLHAFVEHVEAKLAATHRDV
jgi:hypothetical protein